MSLRSSRLGFKSRPGRSILGRIRFERCAHENCHESLAHTRMARPVERVRFELESLLFILCQEHAEAVAKGL